jgi:hypothetical protein
MRDVPMEEEASYTTRAPRSPGCVSGSRRTHLRYHAPLVRQNLTARMRAVFGPAIGELKVLKMGGWYLDYEHMWKHWELTKDMNLRSR